MKAGVEGKAGAVGPVVVSDTGFDGGDDGQNVNEDDEVNQKTGINSIFL